METHHLRYFITVAEELHFGRAALKLHLAQPPLSRHIKALEKYLGVELFYRDRRTVRLTAAGEVFLPTAREILRLMQLAAEETSRIVGPAAGTLTLAVPSEGSHALVREIMDGFSAEVPTVHLNKHAVPPDELCEAIASGFADIGFLYMAGQGDERLKEAPFSEDSAVAVVWKGHRLARRKSIRLHELASEDWALYQRSGSSSKHVWSFLEQRAKTLGFHLRVSRKTDCLSEAMAIVGHRVAVTVIPHAYDWVPHIERRYIPIERQDLTIPLSVYCRCDDQEPVTAAVLHLARQTSARRRHVRDR